MHLRALLYFFALVSCSPHELTGDIFSPHPKKTPPVGRPPLFPSSRAVKASHRSFGKILKIKSRRDSTPSSSRKSIVSRETQDSNAWFLSIETIE